MISATRTIAIVVCLAAVAPFATRLEAQQFGGPDRDFETATHVALGYATNAPRQLMGFSGLVFSPKLRGWGVYADLKLSLESPADEPEFAPGITVDMAASFGDDYLEANSEWTTVNIALVRIVSPAMALYAGGGYSQEVAYRRYFDSSRQRGSFGTYWVEDEAESGGRVNLLGGVWFRATSSVLFQFGLESTPPGVTVGAGYVLPFN